jgi:hypothetical protein
MMVSCALSPSSQKNLPLDASERRRVAAKSFQLVARVYCPDPRPPRDPDVFRFVVEPVAFPLDLLSVSQLADRNMNCHFTGSSAELSRNGKIVATAIRQGKAYILKAQAQKKHYSA